MNSKKINEIICSLGDFYKNHAEEFSKTRQNPWPGWEKCLDKVKDNFNQKDLSVLDIGCGNGRFFKFLADFSPYELNYLGLDNSDYLLVEAVLKYPMAKFTYLNVFSNLGEIKSKHDAVCVFGLTHHLPDNDFRLAWLKSLVPFINNDGLLLLTFWDLSSDRRSIKLERAKDLDDNDFYYTWKDTSDKRYVHLFDDNELSKIKSCLTQGGLALVDEFYSDGKSGKLNKYLIFKRLS